MLTFDGFYDYGYDDDRDDYDNDYHYDDYGPKVLGANHPCGLASPSSGPRKNGPRFPLWMRDVMADVAVICKKPATTGEDATEIDAQPEVEALEKRPAEAAMICKKLVAIEVECDEEAEHAENAEEVVAGLEELPAEAAMIFKKPAANAVECDEEAAHAEDACFDEEKVVEYVEEGMEEEEAHATEEAPEEDQA